MRQKTLVRLLVTCAAYTLLTPNIAVADQACLDELKRTVTSELGPNPNLDTLFAGLEFLPRVVSADRSQPEFTSTFTDYYNRRVNSTRIERGRRMKAAQSGLLGKLTAEYGVQGDYLLALWGLETNYGGYMGELSVPSALATLSCEGRRGDFFRAEFLNVARITVRGDMPVDSLRGSWAGAMGHMQFMPSTYLSYAVDYDGDGQVNVYASLGDAFASAANYLNSLGWQAGYRWGREVLLPANFDYSQASHTNWQPLRFWRSQGITQTDGQAVANLDLQAALILPLGHQGPAFLVYPNFRAFMSWNRSINYALAVGRLADRIAGLGELATALPESQSVRWRFADMQRWQTTLNAQGYDAGTPDGVLGSKTRAAIRAHQKANSLISDGYPHPAWITLIDNASG